VTSAARHNGNMSADSADPGVPVLEFDHVHASYGTYRALFGVSFVVPERGIVALLGANGAGKSTVARVASGLVPVTDGAVRVKGTDVSELPAHRIARLGVAQVPEGRGIFSTLTVEENLVVSFGKKLPRRDVRGALDRAYGAFSILGERRRQQAGTLSGGQQRMLSLAKTLAVPPHLLIADELSLGLAPVVIDSVYDGLRAIRDQGCALLVVEQQIDRALGIADHAVLLAKGNVAWQGPSSQAEAAMERVLATGEHTGDPLGVEHEGDAPDLAFGSGNGAEFPPPPGSLAE
jgi:branched-chain amino acid transport system ATP-binding protein